MLFVFLIPWFLLSTNLEGDRSDSGCHGNFVGKRKKRIYYENDNALRVSIKKQVYTECLGNIHLRNNKQSQP